LSIDNRVKVKSLSPKHARAWLMNGVLVNIVLCANFNIKLLRPYLS